MTSVQRQSSPADRDTIDHLLRSLSQIALESVARRPEVRQSESKPILDRLLARMVEVQPTLRSTAKLAQAIQYSLNRWEPLCRFTTDGRYAIDNKGRRRPWRVAGQHLGAPEVAAAPGLSLPYYYLLERKALEGLVRACEAQPKGLPGPSAQEQLARVERELVQARRECRRLTALVRVTQRAVGLAPPTAQKEAKPSTSSPPRRRRRPVARALRAADTLRKNSSGSQPPVELEQSPAPTEGACVWRSQDFVRRSL